MYNCFDIAKTFVDLAKEEKRAVDTMKLLKLTYIAHGYYLGFFGKPLFNNEVQAWKYGPVIPALYHVIKRFGTGVVDSETLSLYSENEVSKDDRKFLKAVWRFYKNFNGLSLSSKTHQENTPWANTYTPYEMYKVIDNSEIEKYYRDLIDHRGVEAN